MIEKTLSAIYKILGYHRWRHSTDGRDFVWKRYDAQSHTWITRPMTPEERDEAYDMWAIK